MIQRNEIAQIIAKWCMANGEEFFHPLADKIMKYIKSDSRAEHLASLRRVRDEIESRRQKWKCAMFDSNPQYARVRGFEECLAIIDEAIKDVENE
jgi:hypothetical protein